MLVEWRDVYRGECAAVSPTAKCIGGLKRRPGFLQHSQRGGETSRHHFSRPASPPHHESLCVFSTQSSAFRNAGALNGHSLTWPSYYGYIRHMQVKTAELKNNLSKYLRRVREMGETIIVCDRDEPVAALTPINRDEDAEWTRRRAEALARANALGITMEIPLQRPRAACMRPPKPVRARDGRTDVNTIDLVRKNRDW
jgi:prevent-host-death family protein